MNIEMQKILNNLKYWNEFFPNDIVTIGGIAIYLHAYENSQKNKDANTYDEDDVLIIEGTHDGDFYITQDTMFDFQDLEHDVVSNKRLRKHELKKDNISYDIYKEYENDLCVDNQELKDHSCVIDNIRVASLEHLLTLKLKAALDSTRINSEKGEKDTRDIIKIVYLNPNITNKNNFEANEINFIEQIIKNNHSYKKIAQGNDFYANKIKSKTKMNFQEFKNIFENKNKPSTNKLK